MDLKELYWLAGLLEGEGSFSISCIEDREYPRLRITIQMTDEDVIRRASKVTNFGSVYGPYRGTNKPLWVWTTTSRLEVAQLAMTVYPLMGERRQSQIRGLLNSWKKIPVDKCLRGHIKNGLRSCKECKKQQDAERYWRSKYDVG